MLEWWPPPDFVYFCGSGQRGLVEFMCSVFVASWHGVVKYHGPKPSRRPKQVLLHFLSFSDAIQHGLFVDPAEI